jgi:hypothetical protein
MATLHVALQDGFAEDEVVVLAGEREVYRNVAVTTRTQVGLADTFEIETDSPSTMLRVSLPGRRLAVARNVVTSGDRHVGVSVVDGRVEIKESAERFRYA